MNDLTGSAHSFQEWSAVLEFLSNIKPVKSIKGIEITKKDDEGWAMNIDNKDRKEVKRKPGLPGAALYDLYW